MFEHQVRPERRKLADLSEEEERSLLKLMTKAGEVGELVTVAKIRPVYKVRMGHLLAPSMIYRLPEQHGWKPRKPHPKTVSVRLKEAKKNSFQKR